MGNYVHGYSDIEARRLADQANTLAGLLHATVAFPAGSRVLEAGCGIGAQTVHLVRNSPGAHFTSFDFSSDSIAKARESIAVSGYSDVLFNIADVYNLPYKTDAFDHVFICFFLEHLRDPIQALRGLGKTLNAGGTITVVEGDHGSYYCHPRSEAADHVVKCLIEVQARKHGNSLIGRQLYPLLAAAGFREVKVLPRMVYVDASKPELVDGFTRKTFIAMVKGVKEEALSLQLSDEKSWEKGIADLNRAADEDGTFCYTFFQAIALK